MGRVPKDSNLWCVPLTRRYAERMTFLLAVEYFGLTYLVWRLLSWGKPERNVVLSWFVGMAVFLALAWPGWLTDFNQMLLDV